MITEKDIEKIASLARIHLQKEELSTLTKDLESILHYVKMMEKLDTSKIDPTTHPLTLRNVFREDQIRASLTQEEALKIAPERLNGSYKVPKVIE